MSTNSRPSEPRIRGGVSDSGGRVSRIALTQEDDRRNKAAVELRDARTAGVALRRSPDDLEHLD